MEDALYDRDYNKGNNKIRNERKDKLYEFAKNNNIDIKREYLDYNQYKRGNMMNKLLQDIEDGKVINVKYISSLNIRIAREVIGCSNQILGQVLDLEHDTIINTLIVSPPGKGKTTMLRDLIRQISNGVKKINFSGKTCGVVDERGEIAAMFQGVPQNDIGIRTDVIENISKAKGMKMLIRSMAPEIIACDEIGSKEDIEAIKEAILAGVKGIFTMHGKTIEDIKNNKDMNELIEEKQIEKIIFLGK